MGKIALALGILLLATNGAQAQLTVTDKAILRTGKLKLEIHYPQTGRAEIDKRFAKQAQDFAADGDLNDTSEGANSGSMSYRIKRNDAQMFSVEVETGSYYAGHAHPMPDINTYNFLMPEAAQAGLSDFVTGQQGLERVRDLAVADLNRQLQWNQTKLKARESWFQNFVWGLDALELTFPPYAVAGYAQGTLVVKIPLAKLADVIRPHPRTPAASFDCAAAKSRIEKAICSDAELARLDRRVADIYGDDYDSHRDVPPVLANETAAQKLSREVAQRYHDRTVAWQRGWLARRDKACANASVDCLKASYFAHLKEPRP